MRRVGGRGKGVRGRANRPRFNPHRPRRGGRPHERADSHTNTLTQTISARSPLRGVRVANRVGPPTDADLPVVFLPTSHPSLVALRSSSTSPAAWFRAPVATLAIVAADDADAWKASAARGALATLAACESDPVRGPGGLAVLYVPPPGSAGTGTAARVAAKVFALIRGDVSSRRAGDRASRLDGVGGAGLAHLDRLLATAAAAALDARAGAYSNAARSLAAVRGAPGWSFAPLALVKDAAAALAEASGRRDDALREYGELEALAAAAAEAAPPPFGGGGQGDDVATLVSSPWRAFRALAATPPPGPPDLAFRQALFAQTARLLASGGELADRGARCVGALAAVLARRAAAGETPPLFAEAWTFSACVAVAEVAAPPPRRPSSPTGGEGKGDETTLSFTSFAHAWPPPDAPPHAAPADRALAARLGDLYVAARDELARVAGGVGLRVAAAAAADARLAPGAAPSPLAGAAPSPTRGGRPGGGPPTVRVGTGGGRMVTWSRGGRAARRRAPFRPSLAPRPPATAAVVARMATVMLLLLPPLRPPPSCR